MAEGEDGCKKYPREGSSRQGILHTRRTGGASLTPTHRCGRASPWGAAHFRENGRLVFVATLAGTLLQAGCCTPTRPTAPLQTWAGGGDKHSSLSLILPGGLTGDLEAVKHMIWQPSKAEVNLCLPVLRRLLLQHTTPANCLPHLPSASTPVYSLLYISIPAGSIT